MKRLSQITKVDFQNQHIEGIEKLRLIVREMRREVEECQDPYKN
jgi:hypothetical protein